MRVLLYLNKPNFINPLMCNDSYMHQMFIKPLVIKLLDKIKT